MNYMSYECAREIINLVLEDNKNINVKNALARIDHLICMNARQEWHDLRKNPDDLPKEQELVLMCIFEDYYNAKEVDYCTGYYLGEWNFQEYGGLIPINGVIAWKYIDPFEEE